MIGLRANDVDRDVLMIFMICYEYNISFTNMLKLFQISKKYFWTFMEICSPMIKMGVRKAACIRKSVDKILGYFKGLETLEALTVHEEKVFESFTWFLEDSFSDGESCLHVSQLQALPFATGYAENGLVIAKNYEGMLNNLDRLSYVKIGEDKYYKTSRFLYYMEKYSGDTDLKELSNLSVREMLKRITAGVENINAKEEEYRKAKA